MEKTEVLSNVGDTVTYTGRKSDVISRRLLLFLKPSRLFLENGFGYFSCLFAQSS